MNLYDLHPNPKQAPGYANRFNVPEIAWKQFYTKYKQNPSTKNLAEVKKRESIWAKDGKIAYQYAYNVLESRFPAGEPAIAKDPRWAYEYAYNVLNSRFRRGESTIAKNPEYAYRYALYVLHSKFPLR